MNSIERAFLAVENNLLQVWHLAFMLAAAAETERYIAIRDLFKGTLVGLPEWSSRWPDITPPDITPSPGQNPPFSGKAG